PTKFSCDVFRSLATLGRERVGDGYRFLWPGLFNQTCKGDRHSRRNAARRPRATLKRETTMSEPILSSSCFRFTDAARQRYGERADQYLNYLFRTDPLADAVVATLAELPGGRDTAYWTRR